jgi:putative transposase
VLVDEVVQATGDLIDAVCADHACPVPAKEIPAHHVHLFVSIPPAMAVADTGKIRKGTTVRKLFPRFPGLKRRLWAGYPWSSSHYVGSRQARRRSANTTIRKYIERAEHMLILIETVRMVTGVFSFFAIYRGFCLELPSVGSAAAINGAGRQR